MRWLRRGKHRPHRYSVTVAEIKAGYTVAELVDMTWRQMTHTTPEPVDA